MSFSGFTEDDIRRMSTNPNRKPQENGVGVYKTLPKKVALKPKGSHYEVAKNKRISNVKAASPVNQIEAIPESAMLRPLTATNNNNSEISDIPEASAINGDEAIKTTTAENGNNTHNMNTGDNALEVVVKLAKKTYRDLDEFDAQQKLIEEQNRRRKELLAKALADRTKQTQAEAQRLNEIQVEFKKLDAMLSNDVKILRKQIEVASIDYSESQKKFQKIEREFLEAKFLMQQKQEKKDLLTEHLCTIIEKNEERKAEKLNELLKKLQLDPQLENAEDVGATS